METGFLVSHHCSDKFLNRVVIPPYSLDERVEFRSGVLSITRTYQHLNVSTNLISLNHIFHLHYIRIEIEIKLLQIGPIEVR